MAIPSPTDIIYMTKQPEIRTIKISLDQRDAAEAIIASVSTSEIWTARELLFRLADSIGCSFQMEALRQSS